MPSPFNLESWDEPLDDLQRWDRRPELQAEHAVPSGSDPDTAYHVRRVAALSVPFEHADATADTIDVWLCSCGDFKHRKWYETEPAEIENPPACKHVRAFRTTRAQNDENQQQLAQ